MARHRCLGMAEGHRDGEEGKEAAEREGSPDIRGSLRASHLPFAGGPPHRIVGRCGGTQRLLRSISVVLGGDGQWWLQGRSAS